MEGKQKILKEIQLIKDQLHEAIKVVEDGNLDLENYKMLNENFNLQLTELQSQITEKDDTIANL